jgi:hypothetical protein
MWLMTLARVCVLSVARPLHATTRPCALENFDDYRSHELPETGKLAVAAAPRSAHALIAYAGACMSNFVLPSTLARANKKPVDANIVAAATAMMILLGILISMDPQLRFPMFALRMDVEGSCGFSHRTVVQGQPWAPSLARHAHPKRERESGASAIVRRTLRLAMISPCHRAERVRLGRYHLISEFGN